MTWLHFASPFQETDYIMSYFDNGEDFGADSDDNMDEATYWSLSKSSFSLVFIGLILSEKQIVYKVFWPVRF